MKKAFQRLMNEEKGQGLVEYGLIIGLIAVVVIVALTAMGTSIQSLFETVNSSL